MIGVARCCCVIFGLISTLWCRRTLLSDLFAVSVRANEYAVGSANDIPLDMKAHKKDLRQGNDEETSEKPRRTSVQATTGAMSILSRPRLRKLKYDVVVAMLKAITTSLKA